MCRACVTRRSDTGGGDPARVNNRSLQYRKDLKSTYSLPMMYTDYFCHTERGWGIASIPGPSSPGICLLCLGNRVFVRTCGHIDRSHDALGSGAHNIEGASERKWRIVRTKILQWWH